MAAKTIQTHTDLQPGEYGKVRREIRGKGRWVWYAHIPGPGNMIANLSAHQVLEHEDGTITVASLIAGGSEASGHQYRGFLEKGVWRTEVSSSGESIPTAAETSELAS